jgi:hypothetical protein
VKSGVIGKIESGCKGLNPATDIYVLRLAMSIALIVIGQKRYFHVVNRRRSLYYASPSAAAYYVPSQSVLSM